MKDDLGGCVINLTQSFDSDVTRIMKLSAPSCFFGCLIQPNHNEHCLGSVK